MRAIRPLLFRIFYSTSFTVVFLLVLAFVAFTPSDAVYQAWKDKRQWDNGAIAGTYVLTALLAILIYTSRLYTNRSILQGIPKSYIPIEKDDLPGKLMRKEIVEGLKRSAVIAYKARPRFDRTEEGSPTASARISAVTQSDTHKGDDQATWKLIAHPGWSSPASPDLPNLHYDPIIAELPNLIEAKAVSLAPTNPLVGPPPDGIPLPDEQIVEILQRPLNMGLRDYVTYLDSLGLINPSTLGADFLSLYERARFSTKPLDETSFRTLMGIFASILRGMTQLDPDLLAELQDLDLDPNIPPDWRTPEAWSPKSASTFSVDGASSIRRHHHAPPRRVSEDSVPSLPTEDDAGVDDDDDNVDEDNHNIPSLRTAPLPRQRTRETTSDPPKSFLSTQRQPVTNPTSCPRMPSRTASALASSRRSLRPTRSNVSVAVSARSGGSVIRLSEARTSLDLPYTIDIPGVQRGS